MPRREPPLSSSMYSVRISVGTSDVIIDDIYFTSFSGIKDRSQSIQYADGTRQRMRKMIGLRNIEDVTIAAPYKPEEHQAIIDAWRNYTCEELQIEIQPMQCGTVGAVEETPIGEPYILYSCLWIGFEGPEVNRESNDVSRITLTFSVDDWSKGVTP